MNLIVRIIGAGYTGQLRQVSTLQMELIITQDCDALIQVHRFKFRLEVLHIHIFSREQMTFLGQFRR